jgi:hypothetical protein
MKIKISIGSNGYIYEDVEKVKSCHYCTHFRGYGLHWFSGICEINNTEIASFNYSKTAKECNHFTVKEELKYKE